jgi:hypothetical protein
MEDYGAFKLPAAGESIADKAARAIAESGDNPEMQSAGQRLASLANEATKYQVGGFSLSNLPTKAKEGAAAIAAGFGLKIGDAQKKIGALGGANPGALVPSSAIGTSTTTAAQAKALSGVVMLDKEHIVSLTDSEGYVMEFVVLPDIVENRGAQYDAVAPPQFPGAFQKYKGTDSTTWNLNCMFISRTSAEASINLRNIFRLRAWVMPYFGAATAKDPQFKGKIGAPPPVLKLKGLRGLVGEVPVVVTTLNWTWPKDVDYLPAWDPIDIDNETDPQKLNKPSSEPKTPFPAVMSVAINLTESYSTTEFNNFNLDRYRLGFYADAFKAPANEDTAGPTSPHAAANKQEAQTVTMPNKLMQDPKYLTDTSGATLSGITPAIDPAFAGSMLNGPSFMAQAQAKASELISNATAKIPTTLKIGSLQQTGSFGIDGGD